MIRKTISYLCFIMGLTLLCLNGIGIFIFHQYPFDNANFTTETTIERTIAYKNSLKNLQRAKDMPFEEKIRTAMNAVNSGIIHYWPDNKTQDPNLRVPLSKNFILNILSYLDPFFEKLGNHPFLFTNYQIQNHFDMLERGVGICGMQSIALVGFLGELDSPASMIGLNGHVVVMVESQEGEPYILDPDNGILMPISLQTAENNPDSVQKYYINGGCSYETACMISDLYSSKDNIVVGGGAEKFNPNLYKIEQVAVFIKWIIPIALIGTGAFFRIRKNQLNLP
ncbi:hypothetical protein [uncultured Pseudodesulfovibrio sp.]|uniref:hypothetical protein n=1 Tax=uncultured Pseudodesulfovibrio sp. TaxID=2035858 RepID=UPI0029C6698F|nr:hypothetical protein [uncultured Pseudodesulfovibrio sp.]